MANSHTADAAGGEAIYSSDGLSPLPIPPPPSYQKRSDANHNINNNDDAFDSIDHESNNVLQAFEVFSGKVFSPPQQPHQHQNLNHRNETKLERLARIQAELQALEEEQSNEFHAQNNSDNNEDDNDNNYNKEENEIMQVVNDLSNRLKQLQYSHSVSTSMSTTRQQNLTTYVKNLKIAESNNTNDDDTTLKSTSPVAAITTSTNNTTNLGAEQRLFRIEQFLGSQINTFDNNNYSKSQGSILDRLKQAEDKLNSVDEQTLKQAASRAKVIRADLEAASKARSKINNTNVEDAAKITKLYDQLVDLDGFLSPATTTTSSSSSSSTTTILTTIVNRLSSCAALHTQSLEYGSNLKALEEMVNDVEVTLESVEESVKTVENGLVENMKIIQKNIDKLDQK